MPKEIQYPKVSIIVTIYNEEKFLPKFIESIKKTKYPNYEIIFVDNGSIDDGTKIVKKSFSKTKIVKNAKNLGFAGGCNSGIRACSSDSDFVLILNADMYFHPDWLSHLMQTMQSDEKIGVVGYARLFPDSEKIETLGNKCLNENLAKFKRIGAGENLKKYINKKFIEVDFCLGLIRKSVLDKVGLFDEKNFVTYEEVDLCRKIKDVGYKIVINPKSKVWHFGSQTVKKGSTFKIYYMYRNRLRYVLKHNKEFNKIFYGKMLCWIYFYKILKFSFRGRFDCSWAILKGVGWNIKNWRDYF